MINSYPINIYETVGTFNSSWTVTCDLKYFDHTVTLLTEHYGNTIDEVVTIIKELRSIHPHLKNSTAKYFEKTITNIQIVHDFSDPAVMVHLYLKYK